jgi:hypothetical protein
MQRIEWAIYYRKLYVAGLGGRAPEVFVLHSESLRRFAEAGLTRPVAARATAEANVNRIIARRNAERAERSRP